MSRSDLRLAVMIASTRPGRFGPTVARWFLHRTTRCALFTPPDVVDLADLPIGEQLSDGPAATELRRLIGAAHAIVIVTPEYSHSFPGTLKNAIDLVRDEGATKPVAFVSYGGIGGGLRAVEQLRLVLAELHAVTIRETVSFHLAHRQFGPDGAWNGSSEQDGAVEAPRRLLRQLAWWARALRTARDAHTYPMN